MKGLLLTLANQFESLFTRHHFQIVEGSLSPNGWRIVLSSARFPFKLVFLEDRDGSALISFHAVHDPVPDRWFDIVSVRHVCNQLGLDVPETHGNREFFDDGMKTLREMFSSQNIDRTIETLVSLNDQRTRRLYQD